MFASLALAENRRVLAGAGTPIVAVSATSKPRRAIRRSRRQVRPGVELPAERTLVGPGPGALEAREAEGSTEERAAGHEPTSSRIRWISGGIVSETV